LQQHEDKFEEHRFDYGLFINAQTVSALVPPYSTAVDSDDDDEHKRMVELVTSWRTEVTNIGFRVVQLTADVRVSPLVEQVREDGPVTDDNDKCKANFFQRDCYFSTLQQSQLWTYRRRLDT
jgi:hypothetical protein